MAVKVGSLLINLGVDLKSFDKGLRSAERQLDAVANRFNAIGSTLTTSVTAPLAAVGAAALNVGTDFDHSLSQINGLLGASAREVADYKAGILALAGPAAKAPAELAAAMNTIVDAGYKGAAALDVLRVSAKASTAGLGETNAIADAVTVAMNVYGKEQLGAAQATALLIAATREGRGSLAEWMPVLGAVGPVASELGVKFHEVNAAVAVMTQSGLSATESGTALRAMFMTLLKPSTDAQKALGEVGLSADALRAQVREKGLLSVLQSLQGAFAGNEAALTRVFPGAKALAGLLTILGQSGGAATGVFQTLAATGVGDLDRAFAAAENKGKVRFQAVLAELQVAAIRLSDTLSTVALPALRGLAAYLGRLNQLIASLNADQRNLIMLTALFAAVLGPAALAAGALFKTLAGGVAILRSVIGLVSALAGLVSGPMLLAALALGTAAVIIINRWEKLKESVIVIAQAISEAFRETLLGKVLGYHMDFFAAIGRLLAPVGAVVKKTIGDGFAAAGQFAGDELGALKDRVLGSFQGMLAGAGALATGLVGQFSVAMPVVRMQTEAARLATENFGNTAVATAVKVQDSWAWIARALDAGAGSVAETIGALRREMADTGQAMKSAMLGMAQESARSMGAMTAEFARGKMSLLQFVDQMIAAIGKLIAKILILRTLTAIGLGGPFAAGFVGGMFAQGGRPPVGVPSVVGERGPELFVPDTAGRVMSARELAGMSGGGGGGRPIEVVQHISITGLDLGSDESARRVIQAVTAQMRTGAVQAVTLASLTSEQAERHPRRAA